MATIAFIVRPDHPEAAALAAKAEAWLRSEGHEAAIPDGAPSDGLGGADLAVSLGGDGTMLRTLELAYPDGVPVLGVNLGHLGYLTEVEAHDLLDALGRFLDDDYVVEERMILEVVLERPGEPVALRRLAVNEALVEKAETGHTIRLAVAIGGRPFLSYVADGLIVATATGSTAYNLSARGPIASPGLWAIVVTPVSPHMLFDRSLVLQAHEWIRVELLDERAADLLVDGQHLAHLRPGDAIVCRSGIHAARLVCFGKRDFHGILKAKFGLSDR